MNNYSLYDEEYDQADIFSDNSEKESERFYELLHKSHTFMLIVDIIKFFLCIAVMIFDIYLIVIICRNKKLKDVKTNRYIMHYAIFNILMFLSLPFFSLLIEVSGLYSVFGWRVYCIEKQFDEVCLLGTFLCALCITLEWLVLVYYNSNVNEIFLKILNHLIFIMYFIACSYSFMNILLCFYDNEHYLIVVNEITYFTLAVLMIVCNYLNRNVKNSTGKKNYALRAASIMVLSWFPLCMYGFIYGFLPYDSYTFRFIMLITGFIPEYLAYGSPIIVVILLNKLNKHFNIAFIKSCRRSVRDYTGDDDSSDDEILNEGGNVVENNNFANNASVI